MDGAQRAKLVMYFQDRDSRCRSHGLNLDGSGGLQTGCSCAWIFCWVAGRFRGRPRRESVAPFLPFWLSLLLLPLLLLLLLLPLLLACSRPT
jgi:hypothetical protein